MIIRVILILSILIKFLSISDLTRLFATLFGITACVLVILIALNIILVLYPKLTKNIKIKTKNINLKGTKIKPVS